MSRYDNGSFPVADTDTGLPEDPKIRRLLILLPKPCEMLMARVIYEDIRLGSWRAGERLTVEESRSLWYRPTTKVLAAMVEVGLLDKDHRIPARAWTSWYGAAQSRRESAKERSRLMNAARWGSSKDKPQESTQESSTESTQESLQDLLPGSPSRPVPSRPVGREGSPTRLTPSRARARGRGTP